MGAGAAVKGLVKILKFIVLNLTSGVASIAITTITNTLLLAVLLVRFIILAVLKSLGHIVEFTGETFLNSVSFVRDTVFAVLTFIVQTVVGTILFVLNQFVMMWSLVVRVVSVVLGETCFVAKTGVKRFVDAMKDFVLVLKAFSSGIKGLKTVVKAQQKDLKTGMSGVGLKSTIKQSMKSFKDVLMYILKGDEGKIMDGIVPNVFMETFKVLPLSFDLGTLVLSGTFDVSKEVLSSAFSILKELLTLKDIKLGCSGK